MNSILMEDENDYADLYMVKCLDLINTNPKNLTMRGHEIINRSIKIALKEGLVIYDRRRHVGYKVTKLGNSIIENHRKAVKESSDW